MSPHTRVQAHTRNGHQVRAHGRRVDPAAAAASWLTNHRPDPDNVRGAAVTVGLVGAVAAIVTLHAVFDVTIALAVACSLAAFSVLSATVAISGSRRRKRRRRRKPAALRPGRRARLSWYRFQQWRYRRGGGSWGWRARMASRNQRRGGAGQAHNRTGGNPRSRQCPHCGSPAGKPCLDPQGRALTYHHDKRVTGRATGRRP